MTFPEPPRRPAAPPTPVAAPLPRSAPQAVPGYRLGRRLGAGSFGEVWEALDRDDKPVALKFIDCRSKPRDLVAAEVRVLRALSELKHPHIIRLNAVLGVSRYVVLSMERADGNLGDLRQTYIEVTGRDVPPDHALELMGQAAQALDFLAGLSLHGAGFASRGLQHCDVKPSNLLLLGEALKVADFGLCALAEWRAYGGGFRGTPPYAAPELYDGRASRHTDQYALAVMFCELVAGVRPFRPPAAGGGYPGVPVDPMKLRAQEAPVLMRALHPDPARRWPTCAAFVDALRQAAPRPRRRQTGA
jgi:serine/threonine protein kinase